jgi:hypothetical protein
LTTKPLLAKFDAVMNPLQPLRCVCCALTLALLSFSSFGQVSVLTYHYDNQRTGLNPNETILSTGNVNSTTFGKLFSYNVDGYVYAQPLYVAGLTIPGNGIHNVLFIATEHNTVYAFDADESGTTGGLLWKTNLGTSAITPTSDFGTRFGPYSNITPEVGITGTPVIDPETGTIFVDAFTHEGSSYFHRVHALNITNGTEQPFSPVLVSASFPGAGVGSVGGVIPFVPKQHIQRAALTLAGGVVYVAFAGYADTDPYHGWIIGYNKANLQQLTNYVFNTTPNSTTGSNPGEGGIWLSNGGISVDEATNLYVPVGNGRFDGTSGTIGTEFGDCILKLSTTNGLAVIDYFAPNNQATLESLDQDMGSGGLLFLPDQPGPFPHLMVGAGKEGRIYLVNRDMFTAGNNHYNPTSSVDFVVQTIPGQISPCFSTPVYFNNRVFFAGSGNALKAFALTNGLLSTTPVSAGPRSFSSPGATPFVSANGTNNGIVWALLNASPAILAAYNPANLSVEIYNTSLAAGSRDRLTNGVKFTLPIVANGKVYTGGQRGVAVLGLLNPYDNWKYAHFGDTATNIAVSDFFADPDGDGAVNLLEYALASDPNSTNTSGSFNAVLVGNQIRLQFPRNTSAKNMTYILQTTDVLNGSWSNLMTLAPGGTWVANLPSAVATETPPLGLSPDRYVNVSISDPRLVDAPDATNRFYRLFMHR